MVFLNQCQGESNFYIIPLNSTALDILRSSGTQNILSDERLNQKACFQNYLNLNIVKWLFWGDYLFFKKFAISALPILEWFLKTLKWFLRTSCFYMIWPCLLSELYLNFYQISELQLSELFQMMLSPPSEYTNLICIFCIYFLY